MTQLLQNAVYGSALILAVALLRRVLKDRLIPEARLALWAVCLFRLLTPAAPESALSLWGLSRLFAPQKQPAAPAAYVPGYVPAVGTPAPTPQPDPSTSWETALFVLWLAAGVIFAVRFVLSWTRSRRAVACAIPVERPDQRYTLLPKFARLREGPMEGAPLTFGVARPTVVLSPGLEGETLDCVLAHEGVHASRRDNLWHYVMALALAVHWWNPAVWLMSRLLRRDIELSCDRAAVRKLGEEKRADYAKALVSLATQTEGPAFCQTFGRKEAEERILSIMKFKKTSVIGVIFSLALVLALTAAFASEPKQPDEPDEYSTTHSQASTRAWSMSANADSKLENFTINVDFLAKELSDRVADGTMTQEEADRILAQAREIARDGELHWTFPADSGLVLDHFDANGDYQPGFNVYFEGPNGTKFAVDPATVVGSFIFGASSYDPPTYVEVGEENTVDTENRLAGWGNIVSDDDTHGDDYYTKLPTLDENGNWVAADGTIVGTASGAAPCTQMGCANQGIHDHNGIVYDGTLAVCTLDNCGNNTVHTHNGVSYKGWTGKSALPPYCTDESCVVSGIHRHENGEVIYSYYTQGDEPIGEPELNYDPRVADSAGVGDEPVACPPEVIDKTVSAGSSHHSEGHHGDGHH